MPTRSRPRPAAPDRSVPTATPVGALRGTGCNNRIRDRHPCASRSRAVHRHRPIRCRPRRRPWRDRHRRPAEDPHAARRGSRQARRGGHPQTHRSPHRAPGTHPPRGRAARTRAGISSHPPPRCKVRFDSLGKPASPALAIRPTISRSPDRFRPGVSPTQGPISFDLRNRPGSSTADSKVRAASGRNTASG